MQRPNTSIKLLWLQWSWSCQDLCFKLKVMLLHTCYGLNVCVPPKFVCWDPNARCYGIIGWSPWQVIRSWGGPSRMELWTYKKGPRELPLIPFAMWGHRRRWSPMNKEIGPYLTMNLPAPWSWASLPPQLWEIKFCPYRLYSLGALLQ